MSHVPSVPAATARVAIPAAPAPAPPVAAPSAPDWQSVPEGYASTVPPWLRRIRAVALVAVTLWAVLATVTDVSIERATKAVGRDSAPSIVAAETVRSLLAGADGDLADALLVADAASGPFMSSLRQNVRDAEAALLDAARNVTYGDEETGPILTVGQNLARWGQIVGEAAGALRAGDRAGAVASARRADTLMHFALLPAAMQLERVNFDHMTEAYGSHRAVAYALIVVSGIAGAAALAVLVAAQRWLFRRTRRILDPPLLGATLAVAAMTLWGLAAAIRAEEQLRMAKQDAFDSVYALTGAQAWANDARAAESYWLLDGTDAAALERDGAAFLVRAGRLVGEPMDEALVDAREERRFPGLLGDELANITFPGELEAATSALSTWGDYVKVDDDLRALQRAGRTAEAVALDAGTRDGQSAWAFARFDAALRRVTAINETEFREGVAESEAAVGPTLEALQGAAWIAACAGILLGVSRRLRAYEFQG